MSPPPESITSASGPTSRRRSAHAHCVACLHGDEAGHVGVESTSQGRFLARTWHAWRSTNATRGCRGPPPVSGVSRMRPPASTMAVSVASCSVVVIVASGGGRWTVMVGCCDGRRGRRAGPGERSARRTRRLQDDHTATLACDGVCPEIRSRRRQARRVDFGDVDGLDLEAPLGEHLSVGAALDHVIQRGGDRCGETTVLQRHGRDLGGDVAAAGNHSDDLGLAGRLVAVRGRRRRPEVEVDPARLESQQEVGLVLVVGDLRRLEPGRLVLGVPREQDLLLVGAGSDGDLEAGDVGRLRSPRCRCPQWPRRRASRRGTRRSRTSPCAPRSR